MKQVKYVMFIALALLLSSCKSSFTEADRLQLVQLYEQISSNEIHFKADAALPFNSQAVNNAINDILIRNGNSSSRINLIGDNYTLRIGEKTAQFYLPFYGERRVGGGYNNDNSYTFTSSLQNVTSSINQKKRYISYSFTAKNNTETLQVELKIYSQETAQLIINSSQRSYMKYDGHLSNEPIE